MWNFMETEAWQVPQGGTGSGMRVGSSDGA